MSIFNKYTKYNQEEINSPSKNTSNDKSLLKRFIERFGDVIDVVNDEFVILDHSKDTEIQRFVCENDAFIPDSELRRRFDPDGDIDVGFCIENNIVRAYFGHKAHVMIPDGIKSIGYRAFSQNDKLESVELPNTIVGIGVDAFYWCRNLTKINIPDSVEIIHHGAFADCVKLDNIKFGSGLETVGRESFSNCKSLSSVSFKNGLEKIGDEAFSECDSLNTVLLPESLAYLGNDVFEYCMSLKNVICDNHDVADSLKDYLNDVDMQDVKVICNGRII